MDENYKFKKDALLNFTTLTPDNIPRCLNCNLICYIKLKYEEGKTLISYYCENNHKGIISLEEYIQKCNKYSLFKEKFKDCK